MVCKIHCYRGMYLKIYCQSEVLVDKMLCCDKFDVILIDIKRAVLKFNCNLYCL